MGDRTIVMDGSIMDQTNMGHPDVAKAWRRLVDAGAEIWIHHEDYAVRVEADKRAMNDLRTRTRGQVDDRLVDVYMNLPREHVASELMHKIPYKSMRAIALALYFRDQGKQVEFMTADTEAANVYRREGLHLLGPLTPEIARVRPIRFDKNAVNYNHARVLLQLPPLMIDPHGRIIPQAPPGPGQPPVVPPGGGGGGAGPGPGPGTGGAAGSGSSSAQGGGQSGTTARVGAPVQAPTEYGLKSGAGFEAAQFVLQGYAYVIQTITDRNEIRRFNEKWARMEPAVSGTLRRDPSLGALVKVYHSRRRKKAQENDSVIEWETYFQDITVAYGYTKADALLKDTQPRMGPAGEGDIIPQSFWIEPRQPVDVTKLRAPFPKDALATFVPGRATLMDVEWRGVTGFDDKGRRDLDVPDWLTPQFFVLRAPSKIRFWHGGGGYPDTKELDLAGEWPAETVVKGPPLLVTTVELDSWINPRSKSAAIVFPANEATKWLFEKAPRTRDISGQLYAFNDLDLVRWVEPENMRILRNFLAEPK
jgi:hypothetical protein